MQGVPLYQHLAELGGIKPPYVLPTPALNVINGGSHAGNKLAFQEFMLLPTGASSFTEAMKMGTETYHTLKKVISSKYGIDGELSFQFLYIINPYKPLLHKLPMSVTKVVLPPTFQEPKNLSICWSKLFPRPAMKEK